MRIIPYIGKLENTGVLWYTILAFYNLLIKGYVMLNEDRIRLMTDMAVFESEEGKEKLKIAGYFKMDYIGFKMLSNFIWVVIGYCLLLMLYGIVNFNELLDGLTVDKLIHLGKVAAILLLILVVVYGIIIAVVFYIKHKRAVNDVREYYAKLRRLDRMYRQENKDMSLSRTLVDWEDTER